ncbi:MAG: type II toxin-antitoxin system RelE/ParE family toxin [Methanosarcina sp.]|uniref:type II toxin-antitoxin system RelE family toxin n=1 Tax=Methanosarcina sp. TaxID=2213 RepID=UPI003BB5A6DA
MYSVIYTPSAIKDLKKLPPEVAKRLFLAVRGIKEDPYPHVKKLKTAPDSLIYSLRVGEYRVLMTIENSQIVIFVIEVGHRSKIYRKF